MSTRYEIDLNADAGESFGSWTMGSDRELFPLLTSVNAACGLHAGDPVTMLRTVALARDNAVEVGAHPGFPDLVGFGRRNMDLTAEELHASVLYQLGALDAFLKAQGMRLHHVKPHGALHHRMVGDEASCDAVARAIRDYDVSLPFVILAGEGGRTMAASAERFGLRAIREAFPDRAYLADGRLSPRSRPGAVVEDPEEVAERALRMVVEREIDAIDGGTVAIEAETLCIHGDNPRAVQIAQTVNERLRSRGVDIRAY